MKNIAIITIGIILITSCKDNPNKYNPYEISGESDTEITSATSFEISYKKTDSNLKTIHIKLNDSNGYDALFDTGCSGMVISSLEFINLIKSGTISNDDYEGDAIIIIADGSQIKNPVYNIKEVTVMDTNGKPHTLRDIKATVIDNPEAEILIGSAVIDNLAKRNYVVDLEKKIIRFQ